MNIIKKNIYFASILIVICILITGYVYYKSPYAINETFNMIDVNGIYVNPHKINLSDNKMYEGKLLINKKRNIFKQNEYSGHLWLDDMKYSIYSSLDHKMGTMILFANGYSPGDIPNDAISLNYNENKKIAIIIGSGFVLVGPANTVEEAIQTYDQFYDRDQE